MNFSDYYENVCISDARFGSERDTKMFKSLDFNVTAIDGSAEMCKLATEYSGINVKHMQFQDLNYENCFDGIWA